MRMIEYYLENNPRRYKIEGLGEWGIAEGAIFTNWHEKLFDKNEIIKRSGIKSAFGMDFGFTVDPSTLSCALVDVKAREIYLFDEMYEKGLINNEIAEQVIRMGYSKEMIIADAAEKKSIEEIRRYGVRKRLS